MRWMNALPVVNWCDGSTLVDRLISYTFSLGDCGPDIMLALIAFLMNECFQSEQLACRMSPPRKKQEGPKGPNFNLIAAIIIGISMNKFGRMFVLLALSVYFVVSN